MVAKSGEWTLNVVQQQKLYIGTLRRLLGVKKSTANHVVLAELGLFHYKSTSGSRFCVIFVGQLH